MEMGRLTRDGTAEPVPRDQILRRERGQGNIHFPCSADHEQDWQPYPVDPYSCYVMTIHKYIHINSCICLVCERKATRHAVSGQASRRGDKRCRGKTNT